MSKTAVNQEDAGLERRPVNLLRWRHAQVLPEDVIGGRRVLVFFRYVSWFLTSMYYLKSAQRVDLHSSQYLYLDMAIIFALLGASWAAVRLYSRSGKKTINLIGIIVLDTLFIGLLLIPTGGLNSPLMWYALNPVFMAISLLPALHVMLVLSFLGAVMAASALYYGNKIQLQVLSAWQDNPWFSLSFLLLITAVLLFARLSWQMAEAYGKLSCANQSTEELLEHVSNLYQSLEAFSAGEDPRSLAVLLAAYAAKLSGSNAGFCSFNAENFSSILEKYDPDGVIADLDEAALSGAWQRVRDSQGVLHTTVYLSAGQAEIVYAPLKSESASFGMVGCLTHSWKGVLEDPGKAVRYLAELGTIVLERRRADDLAARLLVAEEQNRIANEIHDGVSQQLFSIVYALHALSRKDASLKDGEVQQQLGLLKKTANEAARDLRASIYRISPLKRGEQVFVAGVAAYLDDLAQLNRTKVDLKTEGSEDAISPALRKSLYRIIREATSNAIRHGKCRSIEVVLKMAPERVFLKITDDGRGFDVNQVKNGGLGINNMNSLMLSFKGRFSIESEPGRGTSVTCVVPDEQPL